MTRRTQPQPSANEIEVKLEAENELVERFATSGDPEVLGQLIEKVTGAKVGQIKKVRRSRSASSGKTAAR